LAARNTGSATSILKPKPPEVNQPGGFPVILRVPTYRDATVFSPELKKGSIEMLILSLVEDRARHGYEIGKLIEARSGGRLTFALPTLYPTLLRLENRGLIKGRWVEKAGERERCFYRLTPDGRRALAGQRATWTAYIEAVNAVMEPTRA
jgi:DNA-binding PadR family transcriptional regulator